MAAEQEIAQRIADALDECGQHGDPATSWYGWVELDDVRALVDAVLGRDAT